MTYLLSSMVMMELAGRLADARLARSLVFPEQLAQVPDIVMSAPSFVT